jgi:hypothetical protein
MCRSIFLKNFGGNLHQTTIPETRICKPFMEPRNRFPPGGPERQPYLAYWPARLHRLAESINLELLKIFLITTKHLLLLFLIIFPVRPRPNWNCFPAFFFFNCLMLNASIYLKLQYLDGCASGDKVDNVNFIPTDRN